MRQAVALARLSHWLKGGRPGHYVLCTSVGVAERTAGAVADMLRDGVEPNQVAVWDAGQHGWRCAEFERVLERPGKLRLGLAGVERIAIDEQLHLFGRLRRAREERTVDSGLAVVVCGPFAVFAFRDTWLRERLDASCPVDPNRVLRVAKLSLKDIEDAVGPRFRRGSPSTTTALVSLLDEYVGGDERILRYFLDHLPNDAQPDEVEKAVMELAEQAEVEEIVLGSLRTLEGDVKASRVIEAAGRYGVVQIEEKDLTCEQLFLGGLLVPEDNGRSRSWWRIASPLVAGVVRRCGPMGIWKRIATVHRRELLPPKSPVGALANGLVWEIENLLRNLFVMELSSTTAEDQSVLEATCADRQREILDEARRIRKLDAADPVLRLTSEPASLMSCLELSELEALYKRHHEGFFREHFSEEAFCARFSDFSALRRGVAHNKPYAIGIIERLEGLLEYFEDCVARVAREKAFQVDGRDVLATTDVRIVTPRDQVQVLATLKNISDSRVSNIILEASIPVQGFDPGKVVARLDRPLDLRPRESRPEVRLSAPRREEWKNFGEATVIIVRASRHLS